MNLKNKKVLLMQLGILGGGVATARFLVEHGAKLKVVDHADKSIFKESLEKLKDLNIEYSFGPYKEKDFLDTDILVINPNVSIKDIFVEIAKKARKPIENELTLFYKFCPSREIVAITGTRGKTTTANWTTHILRQKFPNTIFGFAIRICIKDFIPIIKLPSKHLEKWRKFTNGF